jgi:bacterial/archaeal transporter family-2 protein
LAWFAFLVSLLAGAANPFQSATNGELNKQLHQPVWAGIATYASGLVGMLLIQLLVRQPVPAQQAASVPWWAWMGGLISIFSTMAGLTLVQKLGSGIFTSLSLTASLVVSVLLDHFGLLGLKQHPASVGRMIGCGLLIAGVWLVGRS